MDKSGRLILNSCSITNVNSCNIKIAIKSSCKQSSIFSFLLNLESNDNSSNDKKLQTLSFKIKNKPKIDNQGTNNCSKAYNYNYCACYISKQREGKTLRTAGFSCDKAKKETQNQNQTEIHNKTYINQRAYGSLRNGSRKTRKSFIKKK